MPGRETTYLSWRARWATAAQTAGARRMLLVGSLLLLLLSGGSWAALGLICGDIVDWRHADVHMLVSTNVTRWLDDTTTHPPRMSFSPEQPIYVDPAFDAYYSAHAGSTQLGVPLTPAFPIADGMIQFFRSGALLLPAENAHTSTVLGESVTQLLPQDDIRDASSGIVRLALLPRLLNTGSKLSVAGAGSSMTYVDLRQAALPNALVRQPSVSNSTQAKLAVFIPEVKVRSTVRGHLIPGDIWAYITRPDVSPDGWQTDLGAPLTEALPLTMQRNGGVVHARVQAFVRGVLFAYPGGNGEPTIEVANLGSAYLDTLGPPPLTPQQTSLWATQAAGVQSVPGIGAVQAHIGPAFALSWTGESRWVDDVLWYHVQWQTPRTQYAGWARATAVTFTSPGDVDASAEFDALAPDLAAYLAQQGSTTGAAVYDVTHKRYYTYNAGTQFIMASSAKVPIMLAFLTMVEQQGRQPNDYEMNVLTTMIENSNNDSAQVLFDEIGGAGPLESFMRGVGLNDFTADPDAWGYSTITPLVMVRLLRLLHDGKVLNSAQDRQLALNLMENIESDQRDGVGDTAPANATVAMKDGWVQDPDGLWAVNTSGIVTVGGEAYIISVYTQGQNSVVASQDMMRHVCAEVAKNLTPA